MYYQLLYSMLMCLVLMCMCVKRVGKLTQTASTVMTIKMTTRQSRRQRSNFYRTLDTQDTYRLRNKLQAIGRNSSSSSSLDTL